MRINAASFISIDLINSKKQANIILIEDFSLTLHPNQKFEMYARRKSPEISAGRIEKDQQVAVRRTASESIHRLQMAYQLFTARY